MKNDDDQHAAHAQRFRDAGLTAESLAAARKEADEAPPQLVRSSDYGYGPNSVDPADRQELPPALQDILDHIAESGLLGEDEWDVLIAAIGRSPSEDSAR